MVQSVAVAGFGANAVRRSREALLRKALFASTALVGVSLAQPAAAQTTNPSGGGTITRPNGTAMGGAAGDGVQVTTDNSGTITVAGVTINQTTANPTNNALDINGTDVAFNGSSTLSTTNNGGAAFNFTTNVNKSVVFNSSNSFTGSYGIRFATPNGFSSVDSTGQTQTLTANGTAVTGFDISAAVNPVLHFGTSVVSGFATGVNMTQQNPGGGVFFDSTGGSINATTVGINAGNNIGLANIMLQSAIVAPTGIRATVSNGATIVTSGAGTINAVTAGTGTGIAVTSSGGANPVSITVSASIGATTSFLTGIDARITGGTGAISITNNAGVLIQGGGDSGASHTPGGINAAGPLTLTNTGAIVSTAGNDIALSGGGTINNGNAMFSAAQNTASRIEGKQTAISSTGSTLLTVNNYGRIIGDDFGGAGQNNLGGFTLNNFAGGVVAANGGYDGTYAYAAFASGGVLTVANAGLITSKQYAIHGSNSTDIVTNSGTIEGGVYNVANGTVTPGGTTAIDLTAGGTVDNQSGGLIVAATSGIASAGPLMLTNAATGKIVGGTDGIIATAAASITNSGTIGTGTLDGNGNFIVGGQGFAVQLASGTVNNSGSLRSPGAGVRQTSTTGTLALINSGTIAESGYSAAGFDDPADAVVATGTATIVNTGQITTPGFYGVVMAKGGTLTNGASTSATTGTIMAGNAGGRYAVLTGGGAAQINNYGILTSTPDNATASALGISGTGTSNVTINLFAGSTTAAINTGGGNDMLTLYNGTVTAVDDTVDDPTSTTNPKAQIVVRAAGTYLAAKLTGAINLNGGTNTLTLAGTGDGVANGALGMLNVSTLTGATMLVKQDAGTWMITGTATSGAGNNNAPIANPNFTGGTTVLAGILAVETDTSTYGSNALGSGTVAISIGATVRYDNPFSNGVQGAMPGPSNGQIYISSNTFTGAGTLAFSGGAGSLTVLDHLGGGTTADVALSAGGLITVQSGAVLARGVGVFAGNQARLDIATGASFDGATDTTPIGGLTGGGTYTGTGTLTDNVASGTFGFTGTIGNENSALAVTKNGTGTQTLTGTNTYTGATTIGGGTLALSGTGSIATSAVTDNATLDISGLTNGGTSVASLAGTGLVNLGSNVLTAGSDNSSTTFSGVIGGTAQGLVYAGQWNPNSGPGFNTGPTVYSGVQAAAFLFGGTATAYQTSTVSNLVSQINDKAWVNVYGRATWSVEDQTYRVDNGVAGYNQSGDASAYVQDGSDNSHITYAFTLGAVTSNGGFTKTGTGTMTLTGANLYTGVTTVSGGILQGTTGSISGSSVTDNATLAFVQSASGTFAAPISGSGVVTVAGLTTGNTLTFSGTDTQTGGFTVADASRLIFSGNSSGAATEVALTGAGAASLAVSNTGRVVGTTDGIDVTGAGSISNAGTVGTGTLAGNTLTTAGAYGLKLAGATNAVTNTGMIQAGAAGIFASTGTLVLTNTGTISGGNAFAGNTQDAVAAIGTATILNAGTITVGTRTGTVAAPTYSAINAVGGGTITNASAGMLVGGTDATYGEAVQFGAAGTFNNYGSATGTGVGGVRQDANAATTINLYAGSTTGNIVLQGGNDTVSLYTGTTNATAITQAFTDAVSGAAGSVVLQAAGNRSQAAIGTIALGGGTNTLNLMGAGTGTLAGSVNLANVTGATTITKTGTGTWTLTGATGSAAAVINAGTGTAAGTLMMSGTGQTGDIYVNGAQLTLTTVGAGGTGTIHAVDPTINFAATGTYSQPISLEVAAGQQAADPTVLDNTSGGGITLQGRIYETAGVGGAGQYVTFANTTAGTSTTLTNSTNGWAGVTAVNAGVTLIGSNVTISGGSIADAGTVAYNQAASGTVSQGISGAGNVTVTGLGANTLTFGGDSTVVGGFTVTDASHVAFSGTNTTSGVEVTLNGAGGNLLNTGSLTSTGSNAVQVNAASTIVNGSTTNTTASIQGANAGVYLTAGSTVTNYGTIAATGSSGNQDGVSAQAGPLTLNNYGTIVSNGANAGVFTNDAGTAITNFVGGTITGGATGNGGGFAVNLNGGGALMNSGTLNAGAGTTDAVRLSAASTVTLNAGSTTNGAIDSIAQSGTTMITVGGMLSGSYIGSTTGAAADNLTLAGTGTMAGATLGAGNDSFTFQGGTLTGVVDGGAGTDAFTINGATNGTLNVGNVVNFESRTKAGTNNVTLIGNDTSTVAWTIDGGTLTASGGTAINDAAGVTVNAGGTLALTNSETIGSLAGAGAVSLAANTLTLGGDNSSTTFSGTASGTGGGITKTGTGTLTLSGANSYTGITLVSAGTLTYGADDILADTSTLTVSNGATLNLNGHSDTVGTFNLTGTLTGGGTLTAASYNIYAGSTIGEAIGGGALNIYGDTTITATTTAAPVSIYAGTLTTGSAERLADTGAVLIAGGGALKLGGAETIGSLSNLNGTAGTVDLAGNLLTVGGDNTDTTFSGIIASNFTASTTYVGSYAVGSGPAWPSMPLVYSGQGAAALLYGGAASDYSISTVGNSVAQINHLAYVDGYGVHDFTPRSESFSVADANGRYTAGSFSAYVKDGDQNASRINYVFRNSVDNDGLTKTGTGTLTLSGANTYTGTTTVNGGVLALANGAAIADGNAVVVNAGGTLALLNSETIGTLNGAGNVSLGANTLSLGTNNGNSTFSGIASGTGGITQTGTGTLTLSGANAYTGTTTINGGTLVFGASNVLADASTLVLQNATGNIGANTDTIAALTLMNGTLAGTGTLTAATYTLSDATVNANLGAGTLTQAGGTSILNGTAGAGTVAVNGGTLQLGASDRLADNAAVTVASGSIFDIQGFADTVGSLGLEGTLAGTGTLTATTYTLNGAVVNANLGAGMLTQAGGTSLLTGTAGASTVNIVGGTLQLNAADRLADTGAVNIASGGTLVLGGKETVGSLADATYMGSTGGGAILLGGGVLTVGGANTTTTFSGQITGTAAGNGLTKTGTGTLTLSGTNIYTGATTINAGTLALSGGSALADANVVTVNATGTLSVLTSETIGNVQGTGNVALANGTALSLGAASGSFGGTISGAGGLTLMGGTLALTGGDTYAGTTMIGGGTTLALAGTGSIANSAVADAGTFDVSGLGNGGTSIVSLSGAGIVTLGANTLTLANAAGTFSGAIGGTGGLTLTAGTETLSGTNTYTGATTINGGTLTLSGGAALADANTVTLNAGGTLALASSETIGNIAGNGGVTLNGGTVLGVNMGSGTFAGTMSGAGGFTLAGGALTLSGANSYAGTTTIGTGATLTGTSASFSPNSAVTDNGTLAFAQSGSGSFAQTISGSGTVTVAGLAAGNMLTFTGTNTQAGGFQATDASTTVFAGANSGAVTEVALQGASRLVNTGSIVGTTTGIAASAATGTTTIVNAATGTISGGSYAVQGSGAGALTLVNYGTLGGAVSALSTGANTLSLRSGSTTGAVTTGTGNDALSLYTGAVTTAPIVNAATGVTVQAAGTYAAAVVGAIDLGAGNNVLNLRGSGDGSAANGAAGSIDLSTVANAGTITKQDAGTWTLGGAVTDPVTSAATINAGVGGTPGSGGLLVFAGSGLTGTINVNGAIIRATQAGAFGTGTINTIDPTVQYAASGTYANAVVLQSTNPANDPTTLQTYGTGITATLTGAITEANPPQPLVFSSIDANGNVNSGTFVLTNAGNAWTGITTVAGGMLNGTTYATTLQGTTATISGGSITDNGAVNFNQIVAGTNALAISGAGVVQVNGGGNVSLTGALTTTGGVQIGTGGIATLSNASGNGNTVVTLTGANAVLNVAQGGQVAATNGGAVFGVAQNGTVTNAGTVTSTGNFSAIYFNPNLGTATVTNTGNVNAFGSAVYSGAGTVLTVNNMGMLTSGNRPAVFAAGAANVTNGAGGTINGFFGVYANGALTLANAGQITAAGAGGNAVTANGGGTIVNTGTVSATTQGGWGVQMSGAGTVDNQGTINADSGLVATTGTGVSFSNEGTITGLTNGVLGYNGTPVVLTNSGTITGGAYGVQATAAGSAITNNGTIAGSASGAIGVAMAGGTLANRSGGTISAGQTNGVYGTAIQLSGTGNVLALQAGSTVNGSIDASATTDGSNSYTFSGALNGGFTGGSGNDTVTLVTPVTVTGPLDGGAGTDTLVLDGTGAGTLGSAQVANFENGVKQGSGTWTLTGTTAASPTVFAINAGTLAVAGGNALADTSAITIASAGTLQLNASETIGSLGGAGNVTLGANTLTTGGLNASPTFSGVIAGSGGLTKVGTGTLTLSGANTYTGATMVNAGTLALGASNVIADASAVGVATGATLNLGANSDTVASIALSGTLAGTGTLTAATYTLNGGTVTANLGAGTLTQAGGMSVLNGTAGAASVNVNGGTLALGASNRLADNATVIIANGAILDLGANSDTVGLVGIAGTLNGTGTLTAAEYDLSGATVNANLGAGNLFQVAGTSTLNGTAGAANVTVNAGTLVLGASNRLADAAAVAVATGATLNMGANSDTVGTLALNGTLSGTGTLTASTYTLNNAAVNANLGTGTLVQAGGTSVLSGMAATGTVAVMAGTLRLGASDRIADTAMLGVASGATFDLAGYNETVGTLAGSGTLALGAGTLSAGGTNADYAFGGNVTGTGDLTKVGTGTFSLIGNEGVTGRLNVNAGTLMLAGTTAGSVRVQGGTLTGASAIAGNLLLSSGTLSPGIATQPVAAIQAGSLTVTGGTTVFDFGGMASGFTADLLKVTGAATLTGGTVTTRGLDGSANYKMEQTYTVLTSGALTGTYASGSTFTQVSNNSDLYYRLRYDLVANGVVLEVRKPVDFTTTLGAGATGNQLAIAGALNGGVLAGSDAFVTALNAISQLTPDQRRSTLDTIGGESIADISTSVALVGNRFNELLRQRIAVGAAGNSADPSLIAGIAGGKRGLDQVRASGQVGAEGSSFADGHADNHAGAWVQTFGGAGTLDGLNGTASIKDQSYGVAAGIDAKVAGLSIGGAFAASALDTRVEGRSATNRGTLYQGGGYVAYDDGTAYASAVGSYFSGTVTSTRQVTIGTAFQGTAIGTPKVTGYTAGGSVGYRVAVGGGVRFTPQASVQATHVERDAFTETGAGVLSLSAARDVRTLYTATAEGRLSYLSAAPGGIVEPYVGAGAAFAFGDLNTLSANRFTGAPTGTGAFSVTGARLSPTTALVNGGIEAHPNDRVTLGMGVEGRLSNRQRDGRVELHVRLGF